MLKRTPFLTWRSGCREPSGDGEANRARIAGLLGERSWRMWVFHLAFSEAAFRYGIHLVFRSQLARRRDAVLQTRNYINQWERREPAVPASAAAPETTFACTPQSEAACYEIPE